MVFMSLLFLLVDPQSRRSRLSFQLLCCPADRLNFGKIFQRAILK